jgi:hypothetical protein
VEKSDPVKTWLAPTGAKPMGHDDDDDYHQSDLLVQVQNVRITLLSKF